MKIQLYFFVVFAFITSLQASFRLYFDTQVLISFYYESLCRDCHVFIENQLKPIVINLGSLVIVDLIVYGNAMMNQSNNEIICQHGPPECTGNLYQACFIENNNILQSLDFIMCMSKQKNPKNTDSAAQICATEMKVNWHSLYNCAKGIKGKNIIARNRKDTESLNPPHKHVPWITVYFLLFLFF